MTPFLFTKLKLSYSLAGFVEEELFVKINTGKLK